jgi:hypothetical protein
MQKTLKSMLSAAVAVVAMAVVTSGARAQTVVWTGPSDGDTSSPMEISFAPFAASSLDSITGGGYAHNHGNLGVVFGLDLHLNGSWQTVKTWTLDGSDHLLGEEAPVSFSSGTVDGLRLTDSPEVGNGYHGMYGSYLDGNVTAFNFSNTSAVPEPSAFAMLAGSGLGGLLLLRRRRS